MPYESWKDELSPAALAGLHAMKVDLGIDDADPLMQVSYLEVAGREIGAIEERWYGSHTAFHQTPSGLVKLGVFPNFELARQAVFEANRGVTEAPI